jgi:ribosomal protein S18 acetylase RimI-like enzyme
MHNRSMPPGPIIRMLVVEPAFRGLGVGRALTEECMNRAQRDGATCIALHTTPIMRVALPMYERMGFELQSDAPSIFGVPYAVYLKQLSARQTAARDSVEKAAREQ